MKMSEKIPELFSMREACELLKVHPNTLRLWDKKGVLKAVRFGTRKDRKYKKEDVLKLLQG
jgi:excisionase family DNA binding protein